MSKVITSPNSQQLDFVTVLTCSPGKRACKVFRDDPYAEPDDYDCGAVFKFTRVPINSLADLARLIETVRKRDDAFPVYGEPIHPDRETEQPRKWVGADPTLRVTAHHWLCLDVDITEHESIEAWRDSLPVELRDAEFYWLLSANAHRGTTLRFKAFFWFERPITLAEAESICELVGADTAVTRAGQPIYMADPRFIGCADPIAEIRELTRVPGGVARVPTALPDLDDPKLLNTQEPSRATRDTALEAAIDWCKRAPVGVQGARGDDDLFNLLATLIMGYGLDVDRANEIALEHYNPRCKPPWDQDDPTHARQWQHKLDDAASAQRDPEYLIDAYESETFSPAGIKDRCAGDGSAWFEDEDFGQMLALHKADELKYMRVIHEIEKQLPRKAKELDKAIRKAARELSKPTRNVDRTKREIIAFDSKAWVADGKGGYHDPVKRSNLVAFLNNLGRSDLVCGTAEATWNTHAQIALHSVRDFKQRERARWEEPRTVVTGCPIPCLAAKQDAGVDAWLLAMFGDGYGAMRQWLKANSPEHADRLTAALVIIGPTSGGKTFFARCCAKLWGATSYVRLGVAISRFNGSCETTPVWCDDECVELQRGEFTTEQFIELIQLREHDIERKGVERTKLLGACRLVLTCNDIEQLAFGRTAGYEALRALAGRLSVHDFRARDSEVLDALKRLRLAGSNDVDVERVLGHLRWLQETTTLEPARFVGAYNGSDVAQQVVRSQHPEVFNEIEAALLQATPLLEDKGVRVVDAWLRRENNDVLVHPMVLANKCGLRVEQVQRALRPVTRDSDRRVQRKIGKGEFARMIAYWQLLPEFAKVLLPATGTSREGAEDVEDGIS